MLEKLPDAIGHALHDVRAGLEKILGHRLDPEGRRRTLALSSPDFVDHGPLPRACTADDDDPTSPALRWTGVPPGAAALLLIVEDADAPAPHPLVHAIVTGLDPRDGGLDAGTLDDALRLPPPGRLGRNSFLQSKWLPPDPPPGHGPHRYVFQVFALGAGGPLDDPAGRDDVIDAVERRALAWGEIVGVYERPDGKVEDLDAAPPLATA